MRHSLFSGAPFRLHLTDTPLPCPRRAPGLTLFAAALAATLFAALPGPEAGPAQAAMLRTGSKVNDEIDVNTRWLSNGVRIVTVTGPWPGDIVSIRLLVAGGYATATGTSKYAFHFLEHLAFEETEDVGDPYAEGAEGDASSSAYVTLDHEQHMYDADVPGAKAFLEGVVSEWTATSFDGARVERERGRLDREQGTRGYAAPLTELGGDLQPSGALSYSEETELAFADTVSAVTLRRVFNERYAAGRLTLVVAAKASSLSKLRYEIEKFGRIPAGEGSPDPGDLSWLSGDIRTIAGGVGDKAVGFRIRDPEAVPARVRYLIWSGIIERSSEVFAARGYGAIEPDVCICQTPREEIWVFSVERTSFFRDGEPAAYAVFEESLQFLASRAALGWWADAIERESRDYDFVGDRPQTVADEVVWNLCGSSQKTAAPSWTECAGRIDPVTAVAYSRRVRERAVAFRVFRDERRIALIRAAEKQKAALAAAEAADAKADRSRGWNIATVFALGMAVSGMVGLTLIGAGRALTKFRRKGGRDDG